MDCKGDGGDCAGPSGGRAGGAAREGARLGGMQRVDGPRGLGRDLEVGAQKVCALRAAAALTCAMRERISAGAGVAVCGDRDLSHGGGYGGGVGVRARVAGAAGKQGA